MTSSPAVVDATLWCVNIHGPDDIVAAPDYLTAIRMANAFNDWWLELKKKHHHQLDPRMWAVPIEWPHDNGHADDLASPSSEYAWLHTDALSVQPDRGAVLAEGIRIGREEAAKLAASFDDRTDILKISGHGLAAAIRALQVGPVAPAVDLDEVAKEIRRPLAGIENRTPQEVHDIMIDRTHAALARIRGTRHDG